MDRSEPPILVIKLGALGDFVQATGPFAAIRRHHANSPVTLLTTPPFADFAQASPYFDTVWDGGRPKGVGELLALRRKLKDGRFARVYDLQTSDRSSSYRRLFWPGSVPEWSGIAGGATHPHANPQRDSLHTIERQAEQLQMAGIADVPAPDLGWAVADVSRFGLPARYALIVPGGAAHRPMKRWPAERFARLVFKLSEHGVAAVLVGSAAEADLLTEIASAASGATVLAGRTDLLDLVGLARRAVGAVGNDTGPMHICAVAGCPSVVLFSHESDPALCAPRGPHVAIVRRHDLTDLDAESAEAALIGLWDEAGSA